MSINLENGTKWDNGSVTINDVTIPPEHQYKYYGLHMGCPCKQKKCIRFCCPREEVTGLVCRLPTNSTDFKDPPIPDGILSPKIKNLRDNFFILHSANCLTEPVYGLFASGPYKAEKENFSIREDGVLVVEDEKWNAEKRINEKKYTEFETDRYCIQWSERFEGTMFLTCRTKEEVQDGIAANAKPVVSVPVV